MNHLPHRTCMLHADVVRLQNYDLCSAVPELSGFYGIWSVCLEAVQSSRPLELTTLGDFLPSQLVKWKIFFPLRISSLRSEPVLPGICSSLVSHQLKMGSLRLVAASQCQDSSMSGHQMQGMGMRENNV